MPAGLVAAHERRSVPVGHNRIPDLKQGAEFPEIRHRLPDGFGVTLKSGSMPRSSAEGTEWESPACNAGSARNSNRES